MATAFRIHGAGLRARSSAAAATPTGSPDSWVSFNQPYALTNPTFTLTQGTPKSNGGCTLAPVALSLSPGGPSSVDGNEVSVNPSTCAELLETGTPPASAGQSPPSSGSNSTTVAPPSATASSAAAPSADAGPNPVAHAAYTVRESQGYWHGYYVDPLNIQVAGVTDHTHWRWNGGCVTESAPGGNYSTNHWYSTSGWFVAGTNTFFHQDCYQNLTQTTSYFQNNSFCAGQTTYANLVNNFVSGHYDGSLNGATEDPSLGGHCTDLLSYRSHLAYGP